MKNELHNPEALLEREAALEIAVSLRDRNQMQIALARRMGMDIKDWIAAHSKTFSGLLKESPELVIGFSDLEPDGKLALNMLDAMIEELEKSSKREVV